MSKTAEKERGKFDPSNRYGIGNSFAPRRRYRGKMVGPSGVPRAHSPASRPGAAGWECGQDRPYGSGHIPGKFKVQLPRGRIRFP